jgi:hypothetical protein
VPSSMVMVPVGGLHQCLCTVSRADRLAGSCIKLFFCLNNGQVSPAPGAIYTAAMLLRRVAFDYSCEPCLPKFVFGMVVLAATLLITAPVAHAACRSPKNICKHFGDCLQRTSDPNNKDADDIRAGVKARNGRIVLAGAEACARDLGRKQQWDKWARGCSELEFVQIARVELELGKVYCDRYSQ